MDQREATYSFGVWVKARRRALGLTQGALAQQIGVAEVTVRKIEADERRPSKEVAALLAEQLQLDPPTRARFLLAARADLSPDQIPSPAAPRGAALPVPPTPLIGRAADLAALEHALLRDGARLITLTGPPGIGKTRLALELAQRVAGPFRGAVTFVSLAPLSDPELVLAALAQALDVPPAPGEPLERRLVAQLQGRRLLVLDNFEQVLPAAGVLAELLAGAADLQLIITSRAALRLRAEHEYLVPPLALPDTPPAADGGDMAALAAAPAVELFVARAQAVSRTFRLSTANARTVAAICARLDALPLAIELAAARTRSLSLPTLLERLDRHLDLLTDGPVDLPSRQRTLRGAIAWSYELLGPAERRLLQWIGTFVGGFTLDELEGMLALAAAADAAGEPTADDAGAILGTLIDHSLVRAAADERGALRFGVLETVRAFAREQLDAAGAELPRRCHARHFRALAARLGADLTTGARGAAMERLEGELDNLRAAFDWALAAGDVELALGLLGGANPLWLERGRLAEGRAWAARLLALPALAAPARPRAVALEIAAGVALHEGDHAAGAALARESLALAEAIGDRPARAAAQATLAWGLGQQGDLEMGLGLAADVLAFARTEGDVAALSVALGRLAWVHMRRGDLDTAAPLLEEAVALLRGGPHTWLLGDLLWELSEAARLQGDEARSRTVFAESLRLMERADAGELPALVHMRAWHAYREGDYAQAAALFEQNVALLRRRGETVDVAWTINHTAAAWHCAGELERAAAGYAESLGLFRAQGHRQGVAAMLHNLGYVARARGDLATAAANFRESLAIFRAIAYTWSVADAVAGLAGVAAARGDLRLAARLLGAAQAAHGALDASGFLLDPSNVLETGRTEALIAAGLAADEAARLCADGAALSLEEAADLAATIG